MAAECLQYFAGWADKVQGETVPVKGRRSSTPCASRSASSPRSCRGTSRCCWPSWKVAPALATGNTVILKPASQTPLTALALGRAGDGGRVSARRAQRDHGQRGDRRARRSSRILASTRSRSPATRNTGKRHHAQRRRDDQARDARAGRQVAEHRVRRRRPRRGACAARRRASSTARARSARPDRGCWSIGRSRTSSSPRSPRGRRRWCPAIRSIPKTRLGAISSKAQLDRVLSYVELGEAGGRGARCRRRAGRHRHRQGLLHAADRLRRRDARR